MNKPYETEETIFAAALLCVTPAARAAYLDQACAGRPDLRRAVEELLRASDEGQSFLEHPPLVPRSPQATAPLTSALPTDEGPGTQIGRYKLLEKIGEGGFGEVYVAEQREPVKRKVALKIIKLGMDSRQVIARFEAERQALAMMDHPNIAKVFDAGTTGEAGSQISNLRSEITKGRPYFVMELVRGIAITQYCDANQLSTQDRLKLFILVCQAIQHAHQKGIIHRDIKPSNILVTLHDGEPMPKVIDFGIAKATQGKLTDQTIHTQFHQFIGTPAYVSPEQAQMTSQDIDTRSDIYSLGVLLYELLVGQTPFDSREMLNVGMEAMLRIIREQEPISPSTRLATLEGNIRTSVAQSRGSTNASKLASSLRGDLDWIVMKCLEKDRTRRYDTAAGLAADIQRHMGNEPVAARPVTAVYRFRKAVRRNKLLFTAASAVIAALAIGLGVSTWKTLEARRAQQDADSERAAAEQQRLRAEAALQLMQIQKAEALFEMRKSAEGVAYLAQVLRANPTNGIAAARLVSAIFRPFCRPSIEPLLHEQPVTFAEFSPEGKRVVTASLDKTVRVWDVRTGQQITPPLQHEKGVLFAAFSPDGHRVVTASSDGAARVWDARSGQQLAQTLRHDNLVRVAHFSPDGQQVVTASNDGTARLWNAHTGQPLTEPLRHDDPEAAVFSAMFSPDGQRVVTASTDGTAQLWDAHTGQSLTEPLQHDNSVNYAEFSPDGQRVVTASGDGTARIWDARTGQPLAQPLQHDRFGVVSVARFSPDGQRVVTASWGGTAQLWDALTGQPLTEPLQHDDAVKYVEFSPDGRRLLTASNDRTARLWDVRTGQSVTEPLQHDDQVLVARFDPDGQGVVTVSGDRSALLWNVNTGQILREPLRHKQQVMDARFSSDGQQIVTGSYDNTARVWDVNSGRPLTEPLQHQGMVESAAFSPDGQRVVTGSTDKTARVWDARSGRPVTEPLPHKEIVWSAMFSPDGRRVLTTRVWDAVTGSPLTESLGQYVRRAAFSVDGQRVVTVGGDQTVRVWDAGSGRPLTEPMSPNGIVHSAKFSQDGQRLVTSSSKAVQVWDARTGQQITKPIRPQGAVRSAEFSPDGRRIVTASGDGTARLWDAFTSQPLTESLRHQGNVKSAVFSSDGHQVVTSSDDGTARVWDAQTGQPLTEVLRHDHRLNRAEFSPNGKQVVTASADNTAKVWNVASPPTPVPGWFIDWAEARGGRRFSPLNANDHIPISEQLRQRELVSARTDTNFYTQIAQWIQADPATRLISPWATVTVPEYVQHRIEENLLPSLREAVRLAPTNGLAWARLSRLESAQDKALNPGRLAEAAFSARRAVDLEPETAETWWTLGAIQLQAGPAAEALQSIDRALEFQPRDPVPWDLKGDALLKDRRPAEGLDAYRRALELYFATDSDASTCALKAAAAQLWFGNVADYSTNCQRMIERAAGSDQPDIANRVAKLTSLRPQADRQLAGVALALARRAVELGQNDGSLPKLQLTLGMTEYRSGNYGDAERTLETADLATINKYIEEAARHGVSSRGLKEMRRMRLRLAPPSDPYVSSTGGFYRAMCLFQQGQVPKARQIFAETEAKMKPLPADEKNPFADEVNPDDLILWLAYKEAKALLSSSTQHEPN